MKGPVPVGKALSNSAELAHIDCSAKTLNARNQVSSGCPTSLMVTSGQGLLFPPVDLTVFWPKNRPSETRAQGVVAVASMSRKLMTG
ncbi:hypothetical protein D3C75_1213890 [compost metagenome]